MSLSVTGGSNGFEAQLEDMERYGQALVGGGQDLVRLGVQIEGRGLDPAFALAGVLAPVTAVTAEGAIAAAAVSVGAEGLLLLAEGELLLIGIGIYRAADLASKWAVQNLLHPLERELGRLIAPRLVGGAVVIGAGLWLLNEVNPHAAKELEGMISTQVQTFLYEHPDVQRALIDAAPWFLQGVAEGTMGDLGTYLLTDGKWPTNDYGDAVKGLIILGNKFGQFNDNGDWTVGVYPPVKEINHKPVLDSDGKPVLDCPPNWRPPDPPHSLEDIMRHQDELNAKAGDDNRIEITKIEGNPPRYIVTVNCTQQWNLNHVEGKIFDLSSNLHLMTADDAKVQQQVLKAMEAAHIQPGDPVMLTGYSQGGIITGRIASDPNVHYNIQSMVTFGSPVSRMDIPDSVKVLSVQHTSDVVSQLAGQANPDRPNWTTVTEDVSWDAGRADPLSLEGSYVYASHEPGGYIKTAADIDVSTDPSIEAWKQGSQEFLNGGNATVQQYRIVQQ